MKAPKMKDPENSMARANANYDRLKDARDVDKAFNEWVVKNDIYWGVIPLNTVTKIATDIKAFARYYAQRCEGVLDSECQHPYHSVVGGGGKPERCLKCGKVLSD
jgi:hypothetical protein